MFMVTIIFGCVAQLYTFIVIIMFLAVFAKVQRRSGLCSSAFSAWNSLLTRITERTSEWHNRT